MATLTKRPDSKYWIACFTAADGRQLKKSTKMTDKSGAMRMALEYEAAGRGDMTVRQARTVLSGLMDKKKEMVQITVRQWVTTWVARREAEVSLATYRFYESTGKKWIKWLGVAADRPLASQTVSDLTAFRNAMLEKTTSESANHRMRGIASMFKAALQERKIEENPMTFVKGLKPTPEAERVNRKPFTLPQINAILAVSDPEWRSMVKCAVYIGQRLSDIATLEWSKVDMAGKTISLKTRKTGRVMQLPMAPDLFDHLTVWQAGRANRATQFPEDLHGYLHPKAAGVIGRTESSSRLSNEFSVIMMNAGVRKAENVCPREGTGKGRDVKRKTQPLSFHSLRHTATSWMKEAGIPQSVVQEFIGHDDATMSRLYTHTGDDAMRKAAASLPKLK